MSNAKLTSFARLWWRSLLLASRGCWRELCRLLPILALSPFRLADPGAAVYYRPARRPSDIAGSIRLAPGCDKKEPKRCLAFSHNLDYEGASLSLLELMLALTRQKKVKATVLSPSTGPLAEAYRQGGIGVEILTADIGRPSGWHEYQLGGERLSALVERWRPGLVVANTLHAFYGVDLALRHSLPNLWIIREQEDWRTCFDFLPALVARQALDCVTRCSQMVFVSRAGFDAWRKLDLRSDFTVIPTIPAPDRLKREAAGLERPSARRDLGVGDSEVALLMVGTLCERKNQEELLLALSQMSSEAALRTRVFLVGDRPGSAYSDHLHRALMELPALWRNRITMVEETWTIGKYYLAGDIFVCTSRREAYPRVIMEAIYHGLPIVTTSAGDIADMVQSGYGAIFYSSGRPDQLAGVLNQLLENPKELPKLEIAADGANVIEKHFSHMVAAYIDTITRVCEYTETA